MKKRERDELVLLLLPSGGRTYIRRTCFLLITLLALGLAWLGLWALQSFPHTPTPSFPFPNQTQSPVCQCARNPQQRALVMTNSHSFMGCKPNTPTVPLHTLRQLCAEEVTYIVCVLNPCKVITTYKCAAGDLDGQSRMRRVGSRPEAVSHFSSLSLPNCDLRTSTTTSKSFFYGCFS